MPAALIAEIPSETMTIALALVALLTGLVVLLSKASPLTENVGPWSLGIGAASIVLILLTAGISRVRSKGEETATGSRRLLIAGFIASAFLVLRAGLWLVPQLLPNLWVVEGIYYSTLAVLGICLARFCRAPGYVAALAPLLLILISAASQFATLMLSSEASFQYGPEKPLFAIAGFVKLMAVSPLDVAVTWSAWRLTCTFQRPDQAPAPIPQARHGSA